jgi:hypothetical protein
MGRLTSCFTTLLLILSGASIASAQLPEIYISSEGQGTLQQLNLNTSKLTTLYTIGGKPDDMTVNSSGQLIYTVPDAGTVNLWNPTTQTNTVLASGIFGARDLEIESGGETMLIGKYSDPAEIIRYNFSTGTQTVLVPKAAKLGTCDGIAYDVYGNLYAVSNHNTIVQINPKTGAIIATLVLEPHVGVNGGDGLTWDSYTNSLWATHDGKTGIGLLQIFVTETGFASTTSSGFKYYPFTGITNVDGIKSDGLGNLYIGAIWEALMYNIPTNTITKNIVVKGADGVSLVPGTY